MRSVPRRGKEDPGIPPRRNLSGDSSGSSSAALGPAAGGLTNEETMTTTPLYETCKVFEMPSDFQTLIRTEVSARQGGGKKYYRIATHRIYATPEGAERRSPWLGIRDIALKEHLEREALGWVNEQIQAQK